MVLFFEFMGFVSALALMHTYIIYPYHMKLLAKKPQNWEPIEEFPFVLILMAARNEEAMIQTKIKSIFRSKYPKSLIKVVVGTDACTDNTDNIMKTLCEEYPSLYHRSFPHRTGKPEIINTLFREFPPKNEGTILVLTDVDALFEENTLAELILPFANSEITGVQAHIKPAISQKCLNSNSYFFENRYMQKEMLTKKGESAKGRVIGGYGALIALRHHLFLPSPTGLIVDDFYWFANLLFLSKSRVVFAENAIARMSLESNEEVQFRRKRRLGKGNLQNFWIFHSLMFQKSTAYYYISHKVLRWFSPWLILFAYLGWLAALIKILTSFNAAESLKLGLLAGTATPLLLLMISRITARHERRALYIGALGYFFKMNFAVIMGSFDFVMNKNSNVWWDNKITIDKRKA